MPRKRKRPSAPTNDENKRVCLRNSEIPGPFTHPVLSLYFASLLTLRNYILTVDPARGITKNLKIVDNAVDQGLSSLLNSAIIGLSGDTFDVKTEIRSATQCTPGSGQPISQCYVVDLVVEILCKRRSIGAKYPKPRGKANILCYGYTPPSANQDTPCYMGALETAQPVSNYPNSHINTLKSQQWERLLVLIGRDRMFKLLLSNSIFLPLGEDKDKMIYYQLCGPPISDIYLGNQIGGATNGALGKSQHHGPPLKRTKSEIDQHLAKKGTRNQASLDLPAPEERQRQTNVIHKKSDKKSYGEIVYVRTRMFYSRPEENLKGDVVFGLHRMHALNRFSKSVEDARQLLKYIFPRQYGLHNVFISEVDKKETRQRFTDYTIRDKEIKRLGKEAAVPRRLKGKVLTLVVKLQRLHKGCTYPALLKYYCPSSLCDPGLRDKQIRLHGSISSPFGLKSSVLQTQNHDPPHERSSGVAANVADETFVGGEKFTEFASTAGEVSGFVKAVICRVIPNDFFGSGANKKVFMRNVDRFVKMRQYESPSLHESLQGLKLTEISWLRLSNRPEEKISKTDEAKRRQLLAEFVYWLFDSFIIPLLNTNFYVTMSGADSNRLFYFRHDVWKKLSEPTLTRLKSTMFDALEPKKAQRILGSRKLGFVQIRLLPKDTGARPIMNLGKRGQLVNGRLSPSINQIMSDVQYALRFERSRKSDLLGSSMFSADEMYPRIKGLQARIAENGWGDRKLYFAKVDILACFDSIPQLKLLELAEDIMEEDEYVTDKYTEVRRPSVNQVPSKNGVQWPVRKFQRCSRPTHEFALFAEFANTLSDNLKPGTVLVDGVEGWVHQKRELLKLLKDHIQHNIVRIGTDYYQQKTGIPQGSVVSPILTSFFYGAFENEKLAFTKSDDCLLVRLIDDFLLITLDRDKATRFLHVMHDGNPEYGAVVNPDKSLVNFETSVNGKKILRLVGSLYFPYCGYMLHTKTLDIKRDRQKDRLKNVDNTITVDYSKRPGASLLWKTVHSFIIQSGAIYFDTELNSSETVVKNIYHAFVASAMKFHRHVKALQRTKTVKQEQMVKAVDELTELAYAEIRKFAEKRKRKDGRVGKGGGVVRGNVRWLGAHAFRRVLGRKQSGYKELLGWLEKMEKVEGKRPVGLEALGLEAFEGYRY